MAGSRFDNFELQRFDEPDEAAGQPLAGIQIDLGLQIDRAAKIKCPRCPDAALLRRPFAKDVLVAIDKCPSCGGNLARLRRTLPDPRGRASRGRQREWWPEPGLRAPQAVPHR